MNKKWSWGPDRNGGVCDLFLNGERVATLLKGDSFVLEEALDKAERVEQAEARVKELEARIAAIEGKARDLTEELRAATLPKGSVKLGGSSRKLIDLLSPISDEEWTEILPARELEMKAALLRGHADAIEAHSWPGKNIGAARYEANEKRAEAARLEAEAEILMKAVRAKKRASHGISPDGSCSRRCGSYTPNDDGVCDMCRTAENYE